MSDLLDKLNVLIRSRLNSVFSADDADAARPMPSESRKIPPAALDKNVDKEIAALRGQLDAALGADDRMQDQLEATRRQISAYDQKADQAVTNGDDATARQLISQIQQAQRRAAMLEAEIKTHQQAAYELMQNLNTLEAAVIDARRERGTPPADDEKPDTTRGGGVLLSDVVRNLRERVEDAVNAAKAASTAGDVTEIGVKPVAQSNQPKEASDQKVKDDTIPVRVRTKTAVPGDLPGSGPNPPTPENKASADPQIEDDLARRRKRLSQ
jgi:hypothetical protein